MSYADAALAVDSLKDELRALEDEHRTAGDDAAAAEADYRRQLAERYWFHRNTGEHSQGDAEQYARGDVIEASYARDRARARAENLAERLEDRRRELASLHRLIEWSQARNGARHD
jgi:hypothetical protein